MHPYLEYFPDISPFLNNQLNSRDESMAVLCFNLPASDPRFPNGRADLLIVRVDAVEPCMGLIETANGVPLRDSLLGFLTVNKQATYVFLTCLGSPLPQREVDLIMPEEDGVQLSARFAPVQVFQGDKALLRLEGAIA